MYKKQNKNSSGAKDSATAFTAGFTLLETLVGLTIFLIAFVALSATNNDSLRDIIQTKRRLTAQYLAEEGIEYVKHFQKNYQMALKLKGEFMSDFVANNCSTACEFYIGNDDTQFLSPGTTLDNPYNVFSIPNTGSAASAGQIGVAIANDSDPDDLPLLKYHTYGLIALEKLYPNTELADSEYRRIIHIEDIPGQDPSQSEAVLVTSKVYFAPADNLAKYSNEYSIELKEIIHFDLQ